MTTQYRVNRDIRMVAAGLAANEAVSRPAVITATGRFAPHQWAIIPKRIPVSFALLPGVDYEDRPDHRPGGGFIGGRNSCIVPDLPPSALAAPLDSRVTLRDLPNTRAEILARLRADTGFHWAPGAMFTLAGWEDTWVAVWLDHFRLDQANAKLNVAVGQAMLATRKMWLRVIWGVGTNRSATNGLITECGAVAVGRAVLDAVALLFMVSDEKRLDGHASPPSSRLLRKVNALLRNFVRLLQKADRATRGTAKSRFVKAIQIARKLLTSIALFSLADEELAHRWARMEASIGSVDIANLEPLQLDDLAAFDAALSQLDGAKMGPRLQHTVWRNHIRRSLLRLAISDQTQRLALLARVRGDLVYRLAMSRRVDRLYALFPWLAAPHPAFIGCALGALGAYTSLLECSRRMHIAHEQKRRLGDVVDGPIVDYPGTTLRLTVGSAREIFKSQIKMAAVTGHGYAASIALDNGAFSHATMNALFRGAFFAPNYPITAARFGRLGWALPAAMTDPRTVAAVQKIEQSRSVMQLRDHDDDLVRHQGMTVRQQLAATVVSVFPNHATRAQFRRDAIAAARRAGRKVKDTGQTTNAATLELVRSMLLTLNVPPSSFPRLRDSIADNGIPVVAMKGEVARAERQRSRATRKLAKGPESDVGQGLRNDAVQHPTVADARGQRLRELSEDVARWRTPRSPSSSAKLRERPAKYDGPPRDDELEDILRGRVELEQIAPVGALALPVLWCAPLIDAQRISWIAHGAPTEGMRFGCHMQRNEVSNKIAQAHAWSVALYAKSLPTPRSIAVACHLFSGCSPVTDDLDHVR